MAVKSLFEIAVPVRDNVGRTVPHGRHAAFETSIMVKCGGYTVMPDVDGAWRDDDGRIYYDRMRSYRVACSADEMRELVKIANGIYADQVAFFVAEIGRAWIVPRALSDNQLFRYTRTAGALAQKETGYP